MPSPPPHVEVVAYALGLLDQEDHEAFELHLADCVRCQAELREFADVPALLDEIRRTRSRTEDRSG